MFFMNDKTLVYYYVYNICNVNDSKLTMHCTAKFKKTFTWFSVFKVSRDPAM